MKASSTPLAILTVLTLTARGAAAAGPSVEQSWSQKMRALYATLSSLMTDVSSEERFKDPKRRGAIEAEAKKLAELSHDLKSKQVTPPDQDPSVEIFAGLFADNARFAYRAFKAGHLDYARDMLRSIPGYCIACHTRNKSGPEFDSLPLEPTRKDLRGIERGEFYASTRQYDRALKEFTAVIDDADLAATRPVEWSHAIRHALAVAVRVKQDPKLARSIVQKVIAGSNAPYFMKEDAGHWLQSIDAWAQEIPRKATDEEGLYTEAVRLIGQAHEEQRYPVDHSADILYLRASSAVHDLLQAAPSGRHSGEAYLMAGICYEVLSQFHIGEVQDIYYEACIRTHPHSQVSAACYHRYQESIYFGYTGSGGTFLPQDERDKLRLLEELAKPAAAPVPVRN